MGTKQTKPVIDVHLVQQRLSRSDILYLKNLFVFLVQTSSASSPASVQAANATAMPSGSPTLAHQSASSSALASSSNMELMSLRLPKATTITYLIQPSFPSLSANLADRFFTIFDYNGYGVGLDYSEYLVMMYTLWYGHPHEELSRFFFSLFDVSQNGKINKKDYRKVAHALLEEYAHAASAAAKEKPSAASSSSSGSDGPRENLHSIFDFYYQLALYHHDRDHDSALNANEFAAFAEEDLLINALMHGRKDPRQSKNALKELLGSRAAELLSGTAEKAPLAVASNPGSFQQATHASLPLSQQLRRNFLGEEEVEESTGIIWRNQKRSGVKMQAKRNSVIAAPKSVSPALAQSRA